MIVVINLLRTEIAPVWQKCCRASKPTHEHRNEHRNRDRASTPQEKKSHTKAKMQYRRRFLDKWLKKQWVRQTERGKYRLTEYGEVVVEVF